jgi:hypothetical protein
MSVSTRADRASTAANRRSLVRRGVARASPGTSREFRARGVEEDPSHHVRAHRDGVRLSCHSGRVSPTRRRYASFTRACGARAPRTLRYAGLWVSGREGILLPQQVGSRRSDVVTSMSHSRRPSSPRCERSDPPVAGRRPHGTGQLRTTSIPRRCGPRVREPRRWPPSPGDRVVCFPSMSRSSEEVTCPPTARVLAGADPWLGTNVGGAKS